MPQCWKYMVAKLMAAGEVDLSCCLSYEQLWQWCGECNMKVLRDGGGDTGMTAQVQHVTNQGQGVQKHVKEGMRGQPVGLANNPPPPLVPVFNHCDSSEKLAAVLYGSRPNVVLVGEMTEYAKIQNAIKRLLADLPMLGHFVAILLEPFSDDDAKPSFLNRALALNSNLPFGCDKLQMADSSLMHIRTHGRFDVWIASSTRDSRNLSPPPTYQLLRLMTPGEEVDEVVFHEPDVPDNQYPIQVYNDLINGLLGSIGLNSNEVHLLLGTDPRNSKLFFTELNKEQVNTVVSQFRSKRRFQIQPVEWYRGAN